MSKETSSKLGHVSDEVTLLKPDFYHRPVASLEEVEANERARAAAKDMVAKNPFAAKEAIFNVVTQIVERHQTTPFETVTGYESTDDRGEDKALHQVLGSFGLLERFVAGGKLNKASDKIVRTPIIPIPDVKFEWHDREGSRYPERYEPVDSVPFYVGTDGRLFDENRVALGGPTSYLPANEKMEDMYRLLSEIGNSFDQ